jgi:hypothetical protein
MRTAPLSGEFERILTLTVKIVKENFLTNGRTDKKVKKTQKGRAPAPDARPFHKERGYNEMKRNCLLQVL